MIFFLEKFNLSPSIIICLYLQNNNLLLMRQKSSHWLCCTSAIPYQTSQWMTTTPFPPMHLSWQLTTIWLPYHPLLKFLLLKVSSNVLITKCNCLSFSLTFLPKRTLSFLPLECMAHRNHSSPKQLKWNMLSFLQPPLPLLSNPFNWRASDTALWLLTFPSCLSKLGFRVLSDPGW